MAGKPSGPSALDIMAAASSRAAEGGGQDAQAKKDEGAQENRKEEDEKAQMPTGRREALSLADNKVCLEPDTVKARERGLGEQFESLPEDSTCRPIRLPVLDSLAACVRRCSLLGLWWAR